MPNLSKEENLNHFWKELVSHVLAIKKLKSKVIVNLHIGSNVYENIEVSDLKTNDEEIWIELSDQLRLSVFKKKNFELYFEEYFEYSEESTYGIAQSNFCDVFKFYKKIQFKDL